jgi:UDP-glucose 4-epimerase
MNVAHSLLELKDSRRRKLLAASTAEVYGIQSEQPFTEDLPLRPTSPYAVSKAAVDMYLRMAARVYDLNCVIMRPTNSYGRKYEKAFIVEYLITSMLDGRRVYVGAPDSVRDYIHVDDHVNAYLVAAERESSPGEVYNFGSGVGVTNRILAKMCSELLGFDIHNIEFGSYPPGYPLRPIVSDQPYLVLDSSKAKARLDWTPKISLEQGLHMVADYWKSQSNVRKI